MVKVLIVVIEDYYYNARVYYIVTYMCIYIYKHLCL